MGDERLVQVANLRTLLVAWVIGGHALLGYTTVGGWPYDEVNEVTFTPGVEFGLTVLIGPSGLFVIGGFFFIAGLFTPVSLRRKGTRRFIGERMWRLGMPWASSALVLWPLSLWVAYRASGHDVTPWWVLANRYPLLDSGALWFALVLLIFSVSYALWPHPDTGPEAGVAAETATLTGWHLVLAAAGIVVSTFGVRLWFPARSGQVADLHLWQWPQCLGMFLLGCVAARHGWVRRVPAAVRRGCGRVAVVTLVVTPLVAVALGVTDVAAGTAVDPFLGGWRWQALATACVEGILVVSGSVWLLGVAQRSFDWTGPLATACERGAFPAFVSQGPVLVLTAVALRPLAAPAEVKAFVLVVAGIAGCFWLGWWFTRRSAGKHQPRGEHAT